MKVGHLLLFVFFAGCSSGRVITYAHPKATFDQYRTYRIESHEKIAELSPQGYATYQRFNNLIAQELESRGYRYHLEADLLVEFKISSGLGPSTSSNYYDRYSWYYPDYRYQENARQPMEGLLEIVLIDSGRKKPAWTGSADITIRQRRSHYEEQLQEKIKEIFAEYPYTAPK